MKWSASFGLFCLALSGFAVVGVSACENTVTICGNTMFDEIQAADGNNTLICAAVDVALECVVRETGSCDLLTKADIVSAMNGMINLYTAAPYNCVLVNANHEAFNDTCSGPLSACNVIYYSAEFAVTLSDSCGGFQAYIECMQNNITSCDVSSPTITEAINNATIKMNSPPYSCNQTNGNDMCGSQLFNCNLIYDNIELSATATQACLLFDSYLQCMRNVTCDSTYHVSNNESINRAENRMNASPYHCDERYTYDITACVTGFYACVDPLSAIGTSAAQTSSKVCSVIDTFMQCTDTNNQQHCSPRLQTEYTMNAENLTTTFNGDPYYCSADNPCLEVFRGCNVSEINLQPASGCGLIDIYNACLNAVEPICDFDKFVDTRSLVESLKDQIDIDFKCSTTPGAGTTSTIQDTTVETTTQQQQETTTQQKTTEQQQTSPTTTAIKETTKTADTTTTAVNQPQTDTTKGTTQSTQPTTQSTHQTKSSSPVGTVPDFDQFYGNNGVVKSLPATFLLIVMSFFAALM